MLWVTIGNGMRYGSTYLRVATAMGCLAFLCTVMLSPYWRSHDYWAGACCWAWARFRCTSIRCCMP